MLGKIVKISEEKQAALILGNNGKIYGFRFSEWCESEAIAIGMNVEFDVVGEKQAKNVFLAETALHTTPTVVGSNSKLSGKIIKISQEKQLALILDENGRQYVFRFQDWQETCQPEINMRVRFELLNEKQAHHVSLEDAFDSFEQSQSAEYARKVFTSRNESGNDVRSHWKNDVRDQDGRLLVKLEEPNLLTYMLKNFVHFGFTFKGRASTKEYWAGAIFYILAFIGIAMLASMVGHATRREELIFVVLILPNLYTTFVMFTIIVRRLHDFNFSVWSYLGLMIVCGVLGLVPVLNILIVILGLYIGFILLFNNSKQVENDFGRSVVYDYADE